MLVDHRFSAKSIGSFSHKTLTRTPFFRIPLSYPLFRAAWGHLSCMHAQWWCGGVLLCFLSLAERSGAEHWTLNVEPWQHVPWARRETEKYRHGINIYIAKVFTSIQILSPPKIQVSNKYPPTSALFFLRRFQLILLFAVLIHGIQNLLWQFTSCDGST